MNNLLFAENKPFNEQMLGKSSIIKYSFIDIPF
jgi:hypothetical protein